MRTGSAVARAVAVATSAVLAAAGALVGLPAAPAVAATPGAPLTYQVTFVARQCGEFTDIMANRARNNIQESLRDLGKDTVYAAGEPVRPQVEDPNDPNCEPLVGWKLQMGTGITGKQPSTSYLSTVTGDFSPAVATAPSTPELDPAGNPTGRSVQAAVTVTLTKQQADLAQQSSRLWVQGGVGSDTLNTAVFGDDYAFGALRCAIDNLNGDNVEWIAFPQGYQHVFCYYYAVKPPPKAGIINVVKRLQGASDGPATFTYDGNISYEDPDGDGRGQFSLTADSGSPGRMQFVRAAGDEWDFEERSPGPLFAPVSLTCDGPTSSTWTITGRKAVVVLGDGDTVTCTYTNQRVEPQTGYLGLAKVTHGGVGTFPISITPPDGNTQDFTATTTEPGTPVLVAETQNGQPGTWTATETLPAPTEAGHWESTSVECAGTAVPPQLVGRANGEVDVTVSREVLAGETLACLWTNTFVPDGRLAVEKVARGATDTFGFVAQQLAAPDPAQDPVQVGLQADVTATGQVTPAQVVSGPDLTGLPVAGDDTSTFLLQELSAADTTKGSWRNTDIRCRDTGSGADIDAELGRPGTATVTLTAEHPHVTCRFVNRFVPVATLTVSKAVLGPVADAHGRIEIALRCDDGTHERLVVPAGDGDTTFERIVLRERTSCTVREVRDGATEPAPVTGTTVQVGDGPATDGGEATVRIRPGRAYTVAFTNTYDNGNLGPLPPTGAGGTGALAALGALLVVTGAALVVFVRRGV